MNTKMRARAAFVAALALAVTVGAGSVTAAPPASDPVGEASPAGDARAGHGRCAPLWLIARVDPGIENWKSVGLCEVDRRLETVAVLQAKVDASGVLTDAHASALDGILESTATGLREVRAEIDAATELEQLRESITSVFEDYRVYALVARQVWLVIGNDTVLTVAEGLDVAANRLDAAIDAAEEAGKDVGDAQAHLAAMIDHVAAARVAIDGDAESVLALTPADWNDDSAQPVLRAARQSLADARAALRSAMQEARQVLAEIGG